jgi:pyroglutamyl-peptidase
MLVAKKLLLILICAVCSWFTSTQLSAQVSPGTGQGGFESNGFDFENYDIYSMLSVNGQFSLSQIPNDDPTLFTDGISNLGDALLLVSRTTTNGVRDVIVVVSGFGPFPGVPNNQSPVVAQELADLLEQEGIESQVVIIDVLWGEPNDRIDQVITDIACEYPDQQIVWIAFGQGGGFTLELEGDNNQGPFPDAGGNLPNPPNQNNPNGPPVVVGSFNGVEIVEVLDGLGVDISGSNDAGEYICDSTCYKLYRCDAEGSIDLGIFFHVPESPTPGEVSVFTSGIIEVLFGPHSDPDGDGRDNIEDSFPFDPSRN